MYFIFLICVDCETWGLQVREDRTEKGGLGKAKMHTEKRSNQEDVTAQS